jgi:hypothetical protein
MKRITSAERLRAITTQPTASECPVERLGREHKACYDISSECEVEERGLPDDSRRKAWLEGLEKAAVSREYAIREEVSFYQAQSALGALFQLAIVAYQLETIAELGVVLGEKDNPTPEYRQDIKAEINKLEGLAKRSLQSASMVVRRLCPDKGVSVGVDGFLPHFMDWHTSMMDLVAERVSGTSSRSVVDAVEGMWALTGYGKEGQSETNVPNGNNAPSAPTHAV